MLLMHIWPATLTKINRYVYHMFKPDAKGRDLFINKQSIMILFSDVISLECAFPKAYFYFKNMQINRCFRNQYTYISMNKSYHWSAKLLPSWLHILQNVFCLLKSGNEKLFSCNLSSALPPKTFTFHYFVAILITSYLNSETELLRQKQWHNIQVSYVSHLQITTWWT